MKLVIEVNPEQVTLVPDAPEAITSSAGWDVKGEAEFLAPIIERLRAAGIRISVFVDPDPAQVKEAARLGADRVELYTKPYADMFALDPDKAIAPYIPAAKAALDSGIGLNAGHDLNTHNLHFIYRRLPRLDEVSIGHALISDCLYWGLDETVKRYLDCIR